MTVRWNRAQAVERLGGDEELFQELCVIFLEESPKLLEELRQALAAGDAPAAMRAAHSIKGEVSYLSAPAASQAARKLEDIARENNLDQAGTVFAALERDLSELYLCLQSPGEAQS